eukprot:COSAG01_NODE_33030_length_571_cov_0.974576_1_plen_31_part_10
MTDAADPQPRYVDAAEKAAPRADRDPGESFP